MKFENVIIKEKIFSFYSFRLIHEPIKLLCICIKSSVLILLQKYYFHISILMPAVEFTIINFENVIIKIKNKNSF